MNKLRQREIKYSLLLALLVLMIVIPGTNPRRELFDLVMTLLLAVSVTTVGKNRRRMVQAGVVSIIPILAVILPATSQAHATTHVLLQAAFLIYVTFIILADVFQRTEVTRDILLGSICAYFMVGLVFALLYIGIELSYPGSFHDVDGPVDIHFRRVNEALEEMGYFSLVTMTTVGYGDIRPVLPLARSIAVLQAVFGQFYLALMVGRLLARHMNQNVAYSPLTSATSTAPKATSGPVSE